MPMTVRVKVLRHMNGDDGKGGNKAFEPGAVRQLSVADAERLEATGAVKILTKPANAEKPRQAPKVRGAKAETGAPANKAKAAPRNKSAR